MRRPGRFASALIASAVVGASMLALLAPATSAGAQVSGPKVEPNVPVTPEDLINRTASNSPQLATDPTNPKFMVLANRLDGPDFNCGLQLSGDAGRGWVSANPVPALPEGVEKCYAPEVAFDRDGLLYFLFLGLAGNGNRPVGAFITTSSDRGRGFTVPRRVLGPQRYQVRMAMDPTLGDSGRLHLAWLETGAEPLIGGLPATANPILSAYSDDGGRTFSTPVQVSDRERQLVVAPALAVGADHSVHVLYYDLGDDRRDYQGLEGPTWEGGLWSLVSSSSGDAGATFGRGVSVDAGLVPPERVMLIFTMAPPSLVADGTGRLYASWYDARNGDWDVFLGRSGDGGRSWEPPRRVNDDPVGGGSHQYLPRLSVSPGNRLDVVFYDRRNNAENRGNDVYYTYSVDGGASFVPNVRLTSQFFDSQIGPRYDVTSAMGLNEFGGRIALWSGPAHAVSAWTDTRNTGRAFPAQDIFATTVQLAGTTGAQAAPPPLGSKDDGRGGQGWGSVAVVAAAVVVLAGVGLWVGRRRSRRAALTVTAAVALVTACAASAAPLPPVPPVAQVDMLEYRFEHGPIPGGRVVFQIHNRGTVDHRLSLIPMPAELPPIQEQLRGGERQVVFTLASIPETPPGGTGTFAVDLAPGRYAMVCFLTDPDGSSHALKGMATEFTIS